MATTHSTQKGAPSTAAQADHTDNRRAWEALQAVILATPDDGATMLKGNLQRASIAALRVATLAQTPTLRAGFEKLSQVGLFDLTDLEQLTATARAALYACHRYHLSRATRSEALVPKSLDATSLTVRNRMFAVAEHNLSDDPEIAARIDQIRPGVGYLDRANDLVGLADIYRDRADVVRLDGKHFRATDEADARSLASELYEALSAGTPTELWYTRQHRAWVRLDALYRRVARWGTALDDSPEVDTRFPSLRTAARNSAGARDQDEAPVDDGDHPPVS